MNKVNVATNHKAGRVTQVMMEQFADFAIEVNNKLIDKAAHTETKVDQLKEILNELNATLKKADGLTQGPHLKRIMKRINKGVDFLDEYVEDIEKHRKHHV